ncbi:ankyrin repeat, PH and SEC7 domain containing protein secG-like [Anneissia japonica]|uniref:ankyrin repeat, PH and SEC7 domain containing protein secG-like n=1 Tax=Anneissia japonica TaxID=1529436 RepID=UPI0014254DB5|nr:ankyrin repeat, PH and SEC7 domain containing protein secG-like [Anneissia japonica]
MASLLRTSRRHGLHRAIDDCRLHQVRLLVYMGSNADGRDHSGRTPLMAACMTDDEQRGLKIVRILLHAKADLNSKDALGRSALSYAALFGRENIAARLLQEDTIEKNIPDRTGDTPLNLAAFKGHLGVTRLLVSVLIRDGLTVDTRNGEGCTALLLATKNGHYQCAKVLLEEGNASIYTRDNRLYMNAAEWAKYSQRMFETSLKEKSVSLLQTFKGQLCSVDNVGLHQPGFLRVNLPPIQRQNLNNSFTNSYGLNPTQTWCVLNEVRNRQRSLGELVTLLEEMEIDEQEIRLDRPTGGKTKERPLSSTSSTPTPRPKQTIASQKTKTYNFNHDFRILFEMYQNQLSSRPAQCLSRPVTRPTTTPDLIELEPKKLAVGRKISNTRRGSAMGQQQPPMLTRRKTSTNLLVQP